MITWEAEPLWDTLDRLRAVHQVTASDTLTLTLIDAAQAPVSVRRGYKGLDQLKSRLRCGERNVIIRLHP